MTLNGIYTRFAAGVMFPCHERLKRHSTVAVRRAMDDSQWWSRERLADYRIQRLREFLEKIKLTVPYYQTLFAARRFDPSSLRSLADLQCLPMLDKATIRANSESLKSKSAQGLARFNTGGSSGEPLVFYIGRERVSHDVAAKWRATRWWGVDIGDREVVLWGSPIELGAQDKIRYWRDKLLRTRLLPAFEMSERNLIHFIKTIRTERPAMLFGYPSAFAHIAQYAKQQAIALDDVGIRVAFVTSEKLYDHQRELIEMVFGCPVANGYGGRDAGFIAHQCPAGSMHITAEDIIVEIVGRDGQPVPEGQSGEIVVTHMATADFPFVRYRTGDIGVLSTETCSCGRGLPVLREVQGRSTDFIVAADGTVMHGLALIYVIRDLPGIEQFKIIQERIDKTRVLVQPGSGFEPQSKEFIEAGVRERLGAGVQVDVQTVSEIPKERSGKFRYVVSYVAPSG